MARVATAASGEAIKVEPVELRTARLSVAATVATALIGALVAIGLGFLAGQSDARNARNDFLRQQQQVAYAGLLEAEQRASALEYQLARFALDERPLQRREEFAAALAQWDAVQNDLDVKLPVVLLVASPGAAASAQELRDAYADADGEVGNIRALPSVTATTPVDAPELLADIDGSVGALFDLMELQRERRQAFLDLARADIRDE